MEENKPVEVVEVKEDVKSDRFDCECGKNILLKNKSVHEQTKKHKDAVNDKDKDKGDNKDVSKVLSRLDDKLNTVIETLGYLVQIFEEEAELEDDE